MFIVVYKPWRALVQAIGVLLGVTAFTDPAN